jgi:hypothetical protein
MCLSQWLSETHSESLTESEEDGPNPSVVIYDVLSSYQAKFDTKTIRRSTANTSEELSRVPFHILGAPEVGAMFSKSINICVLHRYAHLTSNLCGLKRT